MTAGAGRPGRGAIRVCAAAVTAAAMWCAPSVMPSAAAQGCPDIEVVKLFTRAEDALKELEQLRPDVVFLDIEMPKMNGFAFLKNCPLVTFEVIFTTA